MTGLDPILPSTRDHVDVAKIRCRRCVVPLQSRRVLIDFSRHLVNGLYLCGDARGKAPIPRKGPSVTSLAIRSWLTLPDVNQFSIITELLGTPPDDVIQTIASENVSTTRDIPDQADNR